MPANPTALPPQKRRKQKHHRQLPASRKKITKIKNLPIKLHNIKAKGELEK
jgi:hypothetical protein